MAWMLIVLAVLFLFGALGSFFGPIFKSRRPSADVLSKRDWAAFWILLALSATSGVVYSFVD
jgi:ABC-type Na+ efflux pump permease subunit